LQTVLYHSEGIGTKAGVWFRAGHVCPRALAMAVRAWARMSF
jgi:hypothetical protein